MSSVGWQRVHIGLGGNVGDVEESFRVALEQLAEHAGLHVLNVSGLYKTPPWGDENQDRFLNACASLETCLVPHDLLDLLKHTEKTMKREKTRRWGPRTIDLDILTYGDKAFRSERLEIPHPRMLERGFVLMPLADIAPDLVIGGKSVSEWLAKLDTREIRTVREPGDWWKIAR